MMKRLLLAASFSASLFGLSSPAGANTVNEWDFKAYGGFAKLHVGDFSSPGYKVLVTPSPPRDHEDMGAFHWGEFAKPSVLGINQKVTLPGKSWKAAGRYYTEINPIKPGVSSIHGNTISMITTDDAVGEKGEVIGWVTHYNNRVAEDFDKARVAVNYHLELYAPGDEERVWGSQEMFFFMDVFETDNRLDCCPDGSSNPYPYDDGCADRFRVGVLSDNYPPGTPPGNGVIDVDDLKNAPEPGACFNVRVDTFRYDQVLYEVYLTGFWEAGGDLPVGEGWSPEYEVTHLEVRAEVRTVTASEDSETTGCEPNMVYVPCEPD